MTDVIENALYTGILSGHEALNFCLNTASQATKLRTVKTRITQKLDAMGISRSVNPANLNSLDDSARPIFRESRHSTLLRTAEHVHGSTSILGQGLRWLQCLLHDTCYDVIGFHSASRSVFGSDRRLFGDVINTRRGSLSASAKVGVITTSIFRDAGTYMIEGFDQVLESESCW